MLPVPDPVNQLEMWLHQQKKTAAQRDPSNRQELLSVAKHCSLS